MGLKGQVRAHTDDEESEVCSLKDRQKPGASPLLMAVSSWEGGAYSWGEEVGSGQLGAR